MRVSFIHLSIFLIFAASASGAEIKKDLAETESGEKKSEEPKLKELQALDRIEDLDDQDPEEVNRKKKSATTTFCVEIRPSGDDQRPFQVCEPATDPSKGSYGNPGQQGYYQTPQSYGSGGQEQQKPHAAAYQSQAGQGKPAFTSSVKTFAGASTATAGKPYASHMPYGGYRSNDEEDRDLQLMRASGDSDEDDSLEDTRSRSAYDGYSSSYGAPPSYGAASKKHHLHQVQHGQNGLVITCQPSLAGYGHHPAYHHGSAMPVPSYSYRSSNGRYARPYQPYRQQLQPYGSYQHPGSYKPAYQTQGKPGVKPNAPYQPAGYMPPAGEGYSQPAAPAYPQPAAPAYPQPTAPGYSPPAYKPQSAYSQQGQTYSPAEYKGQAYPPAPGGEYKPETYAPDYKQQAYAPPAPEFPAPSPPKPPSHPPSYAPVPSAVYVPPGTYRASEMSEDKPMGTKGEDKSEKESHTMQKMGEISEQRAAGGVWGQEMAAEGAKKDESALSGGWRNSEGGEDEGKGAEGARENEVDEHNM